MKEINVRKIFGQNVRHYRKKLGLSQEQLAERLDISPNHLSVIETGVKFVSYHLLEKMIEELDISPSALFYCEVSGNSDDDVNSQSAKIIRQELEAAEKNILRRIRELSMENPSA